MLSWRTKILLAPSHCGHRYRCHRHVLARFRKRWLAKINIVFRIGIMPCGLASGLRALSRTSVESPSPCLTSAR